MAGNRPDERGVSIPRSESCGEPLARHPHRFLPDKSRPDSPQKALTVPRLHRLREGGAGSRAGRVTHCVCASPVSEQTAITLGS